MYRLDRIQPQESMSSPDVDPESNQIVLYPANSNTTTHLLQGVTWNKWKRRRLQNVCQAP